MDRVKTGVDGLDTMLNGGLVPERSYLVVGGPGSGKTILCVQFLMEGVNNNERCIYVALEEQAEELKQDMNIFGWNTSRIKIIDTMQDISSGVWALKTPTSITKPEFNLKTLVETLRKIIDSYKPKRLVIDSLTSVKMLYDNPLHARRELLGFLNFLENTGCTTLLTSESTSADTIMEEFLASGVVKLHMVDNAGERVSAVSIQKMRGSSFDKNMRPMKITDTGMQVFPNESVFG